jgi:hypothetical protein
MATLGFAACAPPRGLVFPQTAKTLTSSTPRACAAPQPCRRAFLRLAAAAAAAAALPGATRAGIMTTMSDGGFAEPEEAAELATRAAGRTLDMREFRAALQAGEISRVWFFGILNQDCYFERQGEIAKIGEGYPVERAGSPESPLWVMAQVRDQ